VQALSRDQRATANADGLKPTGVDVCVEGSFAKARDSTSILERVRQRAKVIVVHLGSPATSSGRSRTVGQVELTLNAVRVNFKSLLFIFIVESIEV
jgi:coenzyme F420-reducing hydrogenase gamma subunit